MKFGLLIVIVALVFGVAGVIKNGLPWAKKPKKGSEAPKVEQTSPEKKAPAPKRHEVTISGTLVAQGKTTVLIPGRFEPLKEGDFYEGRRVTKLNQGGAVIGEGSETEIVIFVLAALPNPVLTSPTVHLAQMLEK